MEEKKSQNFKNILKYLVVFAAITALGFAILTYQNSRKNPEVKGTQEQKQEEIEVINPYLITYQGQDGKTALEILKTKATIETKQSSFGEYVDKINDIKGGTDNKYWIFYVNGKMAEIGAQDYITKATDVIEWKFE